MTRKVTKDKKKTHKRTLTVTSYHTAKIQPYSPETMTESKAKLDYLAKVDEERKKLEEIKNKVESYIYHIKNKLIDDEDDINRVTTEEQREEVSKLATDAEDWMYEDGYDADYATYADKYAELSTPFEAIMYRVTERIARPDAIDALKKKLTKAAELLTKWETEKPQVTEEERGDVKAKMAEVEKWIEEMEGKQSETPDHETPAFKSADVPLQFKGVEKLMKSLSKKPKPKPPKKNETETAEEGEGKNATAEGAGEEGASKEEGAETTKEDEAAAADGETKEEEPAAAAAEEEKKEESEIEDEL